MPTGSSLPPLVVRPAPSRRTLLTGVVHCTAVAAAAATAVIVACAGIIYALAPGPADAETRVGVQAAAHHVAVPASAVPSRIASVAITSREARFLDDPGFDAPGVLWAAYDGLRGKEQSGALALEDRLVAELYPNDGQGHVGEMEQVALAVKLARHWSKPKILRTYLALAYFGHHYWGLASAADGYFHATPDRLDWSQVALLVGIVKAPKRYDPFAHPRRAVARRNEILRRLAVHGKLTATQAQRYAAMSLELDRR